MKAVWYQRVGSAREVLQFGDLPTPQPAPGEVRVRLLASGVNPSDVKARAGARGALAFDRVIPHSDGAGVIDAVGLGVAVARVGERVWTWNAAWRRPFGTCAEFVCLPEAQAVRMPEELDFGAGACLGVPAMTAAHATLCDGGLEGQTVLVTGGAGAVGHYAIQFARWAGARVIASVSGVEKAAHARSAGADHVVNYREVDFAESVMDLTQGAGVDRIVEVEFGGNLAASNRVLKVGGVIAAYGSMAAPDPALPFYPMMFNHTTLRMIVVYLLAADERRLACERINRALIDGALTHAIAARFPLEYVAEAHLAVEDGAMIGNVVVDIQTADS